MLNFSVGPVMMDVETKQLGAEEVPYFRTSDFSKIMLECEAFLKELAFARPEDRAIVLTGSGTLAMDAAILNCFSKNDKLLIINGGTFGARFCEIADCYGIPHDILTLEFGETLTLNHFRAYDLDSYTALVVNADETSSGVLYDLEMLGTLCRKHNLFFLVDAISAFLADEIKMGELGIDVLITGSQKALALPPGISLILVSARAQERIEQSENPIYYQNLKRALKDGERGQTPFTPAVGIILQLHEKLQRLAKMGLEAHVAQVRERADYFRKAMAAYEFDFVTESKSNAVTALRVPEGVSARQIFNEMESRFQIWVCPNGGPLNDVVFRVGHIGALTLEDYDKLLAAFASLKAEGTIK